VLIESLKMITTKLTFSFQQLQYQEEYGGQLEQPPSHIGGSSSRSPSPSPNDSPALSFQQPAFISSITHPYSWWSSLWKPSKLMFTAPVAIFYTKRKIGTTPSCSSWSPIPSAKHGIPHASSGTVRFSPCTSAITRSSF
jgi:hypothetical protein